MCHRPETLHIQTNENLFLHVDFKNSVLINTAWYQV